MAKFNKTSKTQKTTQTYEGAPAYERNHTEAWLNMLFSSYLEPQYYESDESQQKRFIELTHEIIAELGPTFVANAACFARDELGMRSISQLVAAILNNYQFENKRIFYRNFCQRPDDMAEIFAAIEMLGDKRSHACVRGFADYLTTLNAYTLGKYKLQNKQFNMYDIINICHPRPTKVIQNFKDGCLETPDTWETKISAAGNDKEKKADEWIRLVEEHHLGYIALIRNLRNILEFAPSRDWIVSYLIPQITNKISIEKSRIFPYQIYTAYSSLYEAPANVVAALEEAFLIACKNVPVLSGNTVVMLDVSGSMTSRISSNSNISMKIAGAVFAVMFALGGNNFDLIKFGDRAKKFSLSNINKMSPFKLIENFADNSDCGYGTDIAPAFNLLDQYYDRILLISDMQCLCSHSWYWEDYESGIDTYNKYCNAFGNSHIYSFDLASYHNQLENPNNPYVHLATSLSEKVFQMIPYIENMNTLIDYINENYNFINKS